MTADKPRRPRRDRGAYAAEQRRARIAAVAAQLMAEEGITDYATAKRKALSRLHLPDAKHLPSNREIEAALREHLALFHGPRLAEQRRALRRLALEAMRFLARFEPRLTGPVLSGTVTEGAAIQLHLSAETPEEVGFWLEEHRIPYTQSDRRLRFGGDRSELLPAFRFTADGQSIELVVFNPRQAREAPLSPVDGRPMHRAGLREVEALLEADAAAEDCAPPRPPPKTGGR
jgi:hypothetical protein